jgi:gas vesicle structural protein
MNKQKSFSLAKHNFYPSEKQVTLCEVLDRVLNKGAVVSGELVISVADIELLYVGVGLVVGSVETILNSMRYETKGIEHESV